jgi:hypothetical protein
VKNSGVLIFIAVFLVTGCASTQVNLTNAGKKVKVGKSDPADNYSELGPVTAVNGSGCGAFGSRGTYDGAVATLKNKGANMGGDYIQIFTLTEPHFRPGCFDNEYKISGTLFHRTSELPSPIRTQEQTQKSNIEKLRGLKSLFDDGIITQEEFNTQKKKLLDEGV